MKQFEAERIRALLEVRHPRPVVEEADIDGIRMLVIIGAEVDTVIQFTKSGGAKMPQLATYPEVAESAANADERLARQRTSGRKNTTGEGVEWPYNWKLADAKAAGKIWYAGSPPTRAKIERKNVAPKTQNPLSVTVLSVENMQKVHAEYTSTVPNNYVDTMSRIENALAERNVGDTATAVSEWLKSLNRVFYRFRPAQTQNLRGELESLMSLELKRFLELRHRRIATLDGADKLTVLRLFDHFRPTLGPVGTGKALHVLDAALFPSLG